MVQMLIENGANVNSVNEDHNSALVYALRNGKMSNTFMICATYDNSV